MCRLTRITGALLAGLALASVVAGQTAQPAHTYALLVGVTKYPHLDPQRWLTGPANDVKLMRGLLVDTFGVSPSDVTTLAGWDEKDPGTRPTRENIKKAFEHLAAVATARDMVVIHLSGHGAQQPVPADRDPTSPEDFEPDCYDEIFLPADAANWDPKHAQVANAIVDDEMGAWLRAIRKTGAFVWLNVDACHSGSMTRGLGETARRLSHQDLGIPEDVWGQAAQRAQKLGQSRGAGGEPLRKPGLAGSVDPSGAGEGGGIVAIYAAQSFEETVELPLPDGASDLPENRFGLLTYQMVDVLKQSRRALTYRELNDLLLSRYRAKRSWQGGPTPYAEGAVDRQVLGRDTWMPRTPIRLRGSEGNYEIDAGALEGVSEGSVLAVFPAGVVPTATGAESSRGVGEHRPLAYVRVRNVSASRAAVEPFEYQGFKNPAPLPAKSVCEVAFYEYGDVRVKLAVVAAAPAAEEAAQALRYDFEAAGANEMIRLASKPVDAEVVVRLGASGPAEFLVKPPGHELDSNQVHSYKPIAADDRAALSSEVRARAGRIYKWRNLLRLAGGAGAVAGGASGGDTGGAELKVALCVHASVEDKDGAPLPADGVLRVGQLLSVRLENAGKQDLDVTVLYLDEDFGVQVLFPQEPGGNLMTAGGRARLGLYPIATPSAVAEHVVAIGVPTKRLERRRDFSFLAQPTLEKSRGAGVEDTLLGKLLADAAFGASRGLGAAVSPVDTAVVISRSWQALPKAKEPARP